MHKLQCIAVAKGCLNNQFTNCLTYLQENNCYRNRFEDQLNVNYREWLFKKVDEEFLKELKSDQFQTSIITQEVDQMAQSKDNIKKQYDLMLVRNANVRRVESLSTRTVHFIFNPDVEAKITPFARKFRHLIAGDLTQFEEQEKEKFEKYIDSIENEYLEEGTPYPIVFENMPFFHCELTGLSRISFSVSDNPYYKSSRGKYYPEIYLINKKSEIKACISHSSRKHEMKENVFEYCEDFRELSLNINDDRKVKINLIDLIKAGTPGDMILLTVKCFDLKKSPPTKGEFDRAWYRLINEDTNQTIDYQYIKLVEKPEGFDEDAPVASSEEGTEPAASPSITYVAGRIFLEKNNRWVYECYNQAFTSDKHPTLI